MSLRFTIELEREVDGRWITEGMDLPGVLACWRCVWSLIASSTVKPSPNSSA